MRMGQSLRRVARLGAACAAATMLAAAATGAAEAPGPAAPAAARVELPLPPLPPIAPAAPPPADPAPSLYRAPATLRDGYLLVQAAEEQPPALKSGKPTTLAARPHDVVQAAGDPKPVEGTIYDEREGRIWFRDARGIAHSKNPLVIADLVVFQRQAPTVQLVVRERSEKAGKDSAAHLALAQDCLDGDLLAEAEGELKRALELAPTLLSAWLRLADICAVQGRRDAEIAAHESALAAGVDAPELRERFGRRCMELGLFAVAAEQFARGYLLAAKAAPDAAPERLAVPADAVARRLLRQLAEARLLGGRADEAATLLARLATVAPDDAAVRGAQALADILAGRAEQALATLRKAAESPDPPVSVRNNLGAALFNSGDHAAALAEFEACRAAAPHHTKAVANAALASAALGRADEARKLLAAIAAPPECSRGYWLAAGYVHERAGDAEAAAAAYRKARELDRACLVATGGLARCLLAKGDLRGAAEAFDDALLVAPGEPEALRGLGTCRYRGGDFAQAVALFRPLASRAGASAQDLVRLGLAQLQAPAGRDEAAKLFAKAAAASRPGDPYALAASAYAAWSEGAADRAEELLRQARRAANAPLAAQYAAAALGRLLAARGEEATLVCFGSATGALPAGWRATGEGSPAPAVRADRVRFEGAATAAAQRALVATVPLSSPSEKGLPRKLARFEATAYVPLTSEAAAGVLLGAGDAALQLVVRTTREPQLSRRLAYRIVRGQQAPTPWADLPGTVALEHLRLGLGLSARVPAALDVWLNGKVVGEPLPFDALAEPPQEVAVGVLAAVEPQQQCLFDVAEVEIVWRKP